MPTQHTSYNKTHAASPCEKEHQLASATSCQRRPTLKRRLPAVGVVLLPFVGLYLFMWKQLSMARTVSFDVDCRVDRGFLGAAIDTHHHAIPRCIGTLSTLVMVMGRGIPRRSRRSRTLSSPWTRSGVAMVRLFRSTYSKYILSLRGSPVRHNAGTAHCRRWRGGLTACPGYQQVLWQCDDQRWRPRPPELLWGPAWLPRCQWHPL